MMTKNSILNIRLDVHHYEIVMKEWEILIISDAFKFEKSQMIDYDIDWYSMTLWYFNLSIW